MFKPTQRTRIKICGLTRSQDALKAARLGVDALGLVFYPPSSRALDLDQAQRIRDVLPAFVQLVGLFVNPAQIEVEAVLHRMPELILQFHGDESSAFCAGFGRPYLKALAMGGQGADPGADASQHPQASGFLLDSHTPGAVGGTGAVFDWTRIPVFERPLILAGGLRPENVAEAVRLVRPWAVDVSSGVESAPGVKDFIKMAKFVDEVRYADGSR
jgi:phosphoribosylanthranilate isomerase